MCRAQTRVCTNIVRVVVVVERRSVAAGCALRLGGAAVALVLDPQVGEEVRVCPAENK